MVVADNFECPVSNCPHVEKNSAYARGYIRGMAANRYAYNEKSIYDAGFKAGVASVDTLKHYSDGLKAGIKSVDTSQIYSTAFSSALRNLKDATTTSQYEYAFSVGYKKGFQDGKSSVDKDYIDSLQESFVFFKQLAYDSGSLDR